MSHTPGPWDFDGQAGHGETRQGRSDKGVPFAWLNLNCSGHLGGMKISTHATMTDEELAADARLIAAAPELLEALQFLIDDDEADDRNDDRHRRCIKLSRSVIKKAIGSPVPLGWDSV